MKRVTEAAFRKATEYPHPCEECGQQKRVDAGAHPTGDGTDWCRRSGSVECPPLAAAEAWYGPLPDPMLLQHRFKRAGGHGLVVPWEIYEAYYQAELEAAQAEAEARAAAHRAETEEPRLDLSILYPDRFL